MFHVKQERFQKVPDVSRETFPDLFVEHTARPLIAKVSRETLTHIHPLSTPLLYTLASHPGTCE